MKVLAGFPFFASLHCSVEFTPVQLGKISTVMVSDRWPFHRNCLLGMKWNWEGTIWTDHETNKNKKIDKSNMKFYLSVASKQPIRRIWFSRKEWKIGKKNVWTESAAIEKKINIVLSISLGISLSHTSVYLAPWVSQHLWNMANCNLFLTKLWTTAKQFSVLYYCHFLLLMFSR